MTTLLAFETATQSCSVALLHADTMTERFEIAPRRHTDLILPMIDALLAERHLERSAIDAIALGRGPGSFMGTRLAISVAQGLGYALNCPLIPVSTLHILAQTAFEQYGCARVAAAWDARMQECYYGLYELHAGVMTLLEPDQLIKPNPAMTLADDVALVGNAWTVYGESFNQEILLKHASCHCYPRASALLTLAQAMLRLNKTVSALEVMPVYLRDQVV